LDELGTTAHATPRVADGDTMQKATKKKERGVIEAKVRRGNAPVVTRSVPRASIVAADRPDGH
jgi:hypothetical protein